jgi:1,4-alpha-glucan branching enzyme
VVAQPAQKQKQRKSPSKKYDVTFSLFAPYNEEVRLLGDWNDWQETPMEKGDDGWWTAVIPLEDGEYQYKFAVKSLSYFMPGEWGYVFDPYGTFISQDRENTIIRIEKGQRIFTTYEWKHDDKPLPPNHELIIYEMHIGDFTGGRGDGGSEQRMVKGTFNDALSKLDHVASLGVNAIELMPVKEFPGTYSWGYNIRSLFAVENSYGTPDDLCRFVDECHARGIRVIIDGVYNHMEAEAPFTKIDYDYWFYNPNPDPDFLQWGPKYNYHKFDEHLNIFPARKYVIESILFWIDHFHIDGIRFDGTYALKHFDVLREFADRIMEKIGNLKPFICIAEHVPEDPAITGYPEHGPMHAAWHDTLGKVFHANLTGVERDGQQPYNLDAFAHHLDPKKNGYGTGSRMINYLDSHDQIRLLWQLGEFGRVFDQAAFKRVKLGHAILMTAPGLPMIFMGTEFGEVSKKTTDYQPLDWVLTRHENNADLLRFYQGMGHLRRNCLYLFNDHFEVIFRDDSRKILAYKRWDEVGNELIVVFNLKFDYAGEVVISGVTDGQWHEYIYDYDLTVEGGILRDTLAESEIKIYLKQA